MLINISFTNLFIILLILFILGAILGFNGALAFWNKK